MVSYDGVDIRSHLFELRCYFSFRYPSERMFYDAMKRKGWEPSLQDLQAVVSMHSPAMERAWSEVSSTKHQIHPRRLCSPPANTSVHIQEDLPARHSTTI